MTESEELTQVRGENAALRTLVATLQSALQTAQERIATLETTVAQLQSYKLGVQVGTTSFAFINDVIKPTQQPAVFDNSNDVIQALNNGQIDGYVVDSPTAYVNVLIGQAKKGVVVGQFPNTGEHFGLVLALGNPLVTCLNQAIAALKDNGTLASLQSQWLADLNYPVLQ